ncbi:hypothetical protein TWF506_006218 [Arthrobotrys conoides]|uniref:Uncharacterized protein n=1 Tax=Arthrobotrys conoides TaxID=74498 RepID=A0AAN8NBR9_9PEZI
MPKHLLSLPYEIKYKILSEAIGFNVDFVFKSGSQIREIRDKAIAEEWVTHRGEPVRLEELHCLIIRAIPTRTPTACLLVSHEFSELVSQVVSDMDKANWKRQSKIMNDDII